MSTSSTNVTTYLKKALKYGVGIVVSFWMLFPIFWLFTTGLKENESIMQLPPEWLVFDLTFEHYIELFTELQFHQFLFNSLMVAVVSVGVSILIGVPAAYSLSRLDVPREGDISFWILSTRMIPPLAILVPLFIFYQWAGMTNLYGLTFTHLLITLPMIIWIVKGFIDDLPPSLEESAMVDGCNRVQAFLRIVVPLITPGIAAASFIGFIFSWNNFLLALVLTSGNEKTAPLVLQSSMGYLEINWGMLGAAGTLTLLPSVILSLLIKDQLVEGMTMGAVKE